MFVIVVASDHVFLSAVFLLWFWVAVFLCFSSMLLLFSAFCFCFPAVSVLWLLAVVCFCMVHVFRFLTPSVVVFGWIGVSDLDIDLLLLPT